MTEVEQKNSLTDSFELEKCCTMSAVLEVGHKEEVQTIKFIEKDISCIALFPEDSTWYNAKVLEVTGEDSYLVLYTDYGNEEVVDGQKIVTDFKDIKLGALVDPLVHDSWNKSEDVITEPELEEVLEDDSMVDFVEVEEKREQLVCVKKEVSLSPEGSNPAQHILDMKTTQDSTSQSVLEVQTGCSEVDLITLANLRRGTLSARHVCSLQGIQGRVELAMTEEGGLLVALVEQEEVRVYSAEGALLRLLQPPRPFRGLSGVAVLSSGQVAVLDKAGLHLFAGGSLNWLRELRVRGLAVTGGLLEGEEGELVLVVTSDPYCAFREPVL